MLSPAIFSHLKSLASPYQTRRAYTCEIDCRSAGISARLHLRSVFARDRHHKIELLGAGNLAMSQILQEVSKLTNASPEDLNLLRLDLAVDISGYSVEWFRRSITRVHTHFFNEIRSTLHSATCSTNGFTLQYGRRPDCIRIYDKIAELQHQHLKLRRRGCLSTFEDWAGCGVDSVVTRVERQYSRSLPKFVTTLADLPAVARLQPFSVLVFRAVGEPPSGPSKYKLHEWIVGTWLRNSIETDGYHATRAFVNKWGRNFRRMERTYSDFLQGETPPDLNGLFVRGVQEQLVK
jgi:hypothetical protein